MKDKAIRNIILEIVLIVLLSTGLIFANLTVRDGIKDEAQNYTQKLDVLVNENSEFIWNIERPVNMESLKVDGVVSIIGSAKVYLENNNERYLILDSSTLKEGTPATGFAVVSRLEEFPSSLFFEDVCLETCSLNGFDKSSYKLIFEISGGAILSIKNVDYSQAKEPKPSITKPSPKKLWLLPIVLMPVILITSLIISKRKGLPKGFHQKLREVAYFSKKDRGKTVRAYNELRSMYVELAESEINPEIKAKAYKAVEKSYESLKKLSQNKPQ
ncbi:hypothetical protein KY360_03855 [Candidatus Woesearchaeota archaeon]|nr:hypothetical protein [Candidatus Woesearchaeota archaeon]